MPRFTPDNAAAALEVQQLIIDWGYELDMNGGAAIADLCVAEPEYLVGGTAYRSHAAVTGFYAARNERVARLQKDGIRTQRHTISNLRVRFLDPGLAEVVFLLVNYSAEGPAPVRDLVGPTIVADCRMHCRRGEDGEWLIALFDSMPVFVGNDPFLNAAVVRE